jgi:hydroxymethylpyrimidine pyrophosphatase-like HAD family hydrolase
VKLQVLVVDFDGTTSERDELDSDVRSALEEARRRGISTVLDTGRTLADLRRLIGDLRVFDAIVAENGAVLLLPASEHTLVLGAPPPPELLEELARRRVVATHGECVVEVDAMDAHAVLDAIRALELPLVIVFNRGRLMVLPQAVSKASGLREALRLLRLSAHNAIAIGDAENDHDMLSACEIGAAVEWGSPALKRAADHVIPGSGPKSVAMYIRAALDRPRLSAANARRWLHLGTTADGRKVSLGIRGRNLLVAGSLRSGRSSVAGLLCEQLMQQGYCVCVMDPEGDYTSLEEMPGVMVLGGQVAVPALRELRRTSRYPTLSVVIDLSRVPLTDRRECGRTILLRLREQRRRTGLPHRIVVDEADHFLGGSEVDQLLDLELGGYTLITGRASRLKSELLGAMEAIVVTRERDTREARALQAMCGVDDERGWAAVLRSLPADHAVLLPITEESGGRLWPFRVASRLTPHARHRHTYLDVRRSRSEKGADRAGA